MTTAALVLLCAAFLVLSPIRTVALLLLTTLLVTNPIPAAFTLLVLGVLFHLLKKLR